MDRQVRGFYESLVAHAAAGSTAGKSLSWRTSAMLLSRASKTWLQPDHAWWMPASKDLGSFWSDVACVCRIFQGARRKESFSMSVFYDWFLHPPRNSSLSACEKAFQWRESLNFLWYSTIPGLWRGSSRTCGRCMRPLGFLEESPANAWLGRWRDGAGERHHSLWEVGQREWCQRPGLGKDSVYVLYNKKISYKVSYLDIHNLVLYIKWLGYLYNLQRWTHQAAGPQNSVKSSHNNSKCKLNRQIAKYNYTMKSKDGLSTYVFWSLEAPAAIEKAEWCKRITAFLCTEYMTIWHIVVI